MLTTFMKANHALDSKMNTFVAGNCLKFRSSLFIAPMLVLAGIILFLDLHDALNIVGYINIQKHCFYFLNARLSQFPILMFNLTQLGDEIIILSLLSIFVLLAPKLWEALLTASLVSCVLSSMLKKIFSIPRPAAVFDHDSFVIIGKTLHGHNSLPSGHSITVFTVLTILLFAFMPQKLIYMILWSLLIMGIGLMLVLTRVGVGAHYPLDTIIGAVIGYLAALSGILINKHYKIWSRINNKSYYPIFILFFVICGICIINKAVDHHLFIFYMALASLIISLYKIIHVYVKK